MMYCQSSKQAVVTWQFPSQNKERLTIKDNPVKVDVFGVANPDILQPSNAFTSFDTGFKEDRIFEINVSNLDLDRVHWIEGGNIYNVKSLNSDGGMLYYTPSDSGVDRFEPFSTDGRIYLFNGFRFTLLKRQVAVLQRFTTNVYSHPAQFWAIEIEDFKGKKFKKVGTGKPTYSVDCGGCPPNSLDCSGCCADCGEIKRKLGRINVRLQ